MHQYEGDILIGVDRSVMSSRDHGGVSDVIKQESHLVSKSCIDPLASSNGYSFSNGTRDTWSSFRDSFSLSAAAATQEAKMISNMAVTTNGQLSQLSNMDWSAMHASRGQSSAGQYYSPPLAHAQTTYGAPHPYGWTDATHGHAQTAYHYGMASPHSAYRQPEASPTNYSYTPFTTSTSLSSPGSSKPEGLGTPSIQDMDAERTIRRARRNRTCFSKHQLESLEEVFKESRYPDVYRREEIAASLDLKEEVVRVWFKNRRAKMKRENKDGKVTSPGSPTSTTPSPKSTTSPTFPSTLYPTSNFTTSPSFTSLPLKPDHPATSPYFPSPYTGYTHTSLTSEALNSHTSSPKTNHVTYSSPSGTITPCDVSYGSQNDVTSSFPTIKCETSGEVRSYKTSPDVSNSGGKRSPTPSRSRQAQSPTNIDQ